MSVRTAAARVRSGWRGSRARAGDGAGVVGPEDVQRREVADVWKPLSVRRTRPEMFSISSGGEEAKTRRRHSS